MIVCKFGGTSVASLESAKNIKKIIEANSNRKFVVVSALGKCNEFNYKITDQLFDIYNKIKNGENYASCIDNVFMRYKKLSESLNIKIDWEKLKNEFLNNISNKNVSKAFVVSRGEYYSALMYSKFLHYSFLDAKDYIIFNSNGKICLQKTQKKLNTLDKNK